MKKIMAMLLALSMVAGWIAMAPVNAHAEDVTQNAEPAVTEEVADQVDPADYVVYPEYMYFSYTTEEGGKVISGLRENIEGYVALPATLDGVPVTGIRKEAFENSTGLIGLIIPDSVTEIGTWAFGNCTNLTTLTLGSGLKTIGQYAFNGCSALTEVTIPASVTTIDNGAFLYCYALEAFNVETGNTKYSSEGGVLFDKNKTTLLQAPYMLSGSYTVPGTVTAIGKNAFNGCESVTEVILPAGLKTIGEAAFGDCTGLTEMVIPAGVTVISDSAFGGCTFLRNVTIPENVTSIGSGAFAGCEQLESITIPKKVTTIGESAFKRCMMLTSVAVPDSVTTIGMSAFEDCVMLGEVKLGEGITFIDQLCFSGCMALQEITIPVGVTGVRYNAFKNCEALATVYYAGTQEQWDAISIVAAGNDALLNANIVQPDPCADGHIGEILPGKAPTATEPGLTEGLKCSVCGEILIAQEIIPVLPAEATEGFLTLKLNADGSAYYVSACDTAATGEIAIPATFKGLPVTAIGDNAFKDCLTITAVTIPDSVQEIGKYAFSNCDAISSIVLPEGITEIKPFTFSYCLILESVSIPESVTVIGESAFSWSQEMVDVTIPGGTTYIGANAFRYCRKVPTFTVPAGVTFIGDKAFSACTAADGIWVDANNAHYCSDAAGVLYDKNKTVLIRGNGAATGTYVIPDTVVTVEGYAFSDCDGITGLVIPDSVTTIGNYAFSACSKLATITMGRGVTTVGEGAFQSLNALTDANFLGTEAQWNAITFGEKNDSLVNAVEIAYPKTIVEGGLTFAIRADGLSYYVYKCNTAATGEIVIPSSIANWSATDIGLPVTAIGNNAFKGCTAITSVVIPDGVTSLGEYSFANCSMLTKVVIPESVKAILERAFESCSQLSDVAIPSGVTNLGIGVFNNCSSLATITIPKGITAIANYTFRKTALTEVVIPQGIKTIGDYAFANCAALTKVTFSDNVTSVGRYAFYNCALTDVYYTGSQTQWDAITVADYNAPLLNATLHLNQICVYGHTEEIIPGKDATCTETGLTEGKKCTVCGEILVAQEVIPEKGHTEEIIPGKDATCTETGLTEGKKCTVCGEILVAQEVIEALGHTEEIIPGYDADCTETGLTEGKKCTVCGEILVAQEVIEALGHTEEIIPGYDADCTETGLTDGKKCTVCGEILVAQEEIPAYGHSAEILTGYLPTCTEPGLGNGIHCWICEEILEEQEILPALGHTEEIIPGYDADCTETGLTDGKKCTVCGEILVAQEEIPAYGHSAEILTGYLPTCTEPGLGNGIHCWICEEILEEQEILPALGHTEEIISGYDATCTETGLTEGKKCTVCGEILVAQEVIEAPGHTEEIIPGKDVTCTETGLTEGKKCTVCGETLAAQEEIPAAGHSPADAVIENETATSYESVVYCATCGTELSRETVETACAHKNTTTTTETVPATCVTTGSVTTTVTCECGEVISETVEEIPATGKHTYTDDNDAVCNNCGFIRQMVDAFDFVNYRVVFSDSDTTHKNVRVELYKLGDKTAADPTDEKALKAIDSKYTTHWGAGNINKILITDAGNYVLLLKYNVDKAVVKVPMVLSVSADPKLIIDKNNKLTVIDNNGSNINHRVIVYYLGENTVEDIYDEAALKAIDPAAETVWQKSRINRLALTKGGNYVLHLCYNVGTGPKKTVAQSFSVFSIPTLKIDQNNMLVATEENAENRNHRVTVFYLGQNGTVADPFDETEVKAAAVSAKTYWGLSEINKVEIKEGGNYVFHLYYNVGTSAKRTLAIEATLTERPVLYVNENNMLVAEYSDASITNPRAYIYNVGDKTVDNIYDEVALNKIAKPTTVWGISSILRKQLTPGTYVIHLHYNVAGGAKSTVAIRVTVTE